MEWIRKYAVHLYSPSGRKHRMLGQPVQRVEGECLVDVGIPLPTLSWRCAKPDPAGNREKSRRETRVAEGLVVQFPFPAGQCGGETRHGRQWSVILQQGKSGMSYLIGNDRPDRLLCPRHFGGGEKCCQKKDQGMFRYGEASI
jgi:hypothetical protein